MDQKFLNTSIQIADKILANAIQDEHGLYWETMTSDSDLNISWSSKDSIYSGNAGICLLFAELYQQTKSEKYLQTAQAGFRSLLHFCEQNPNANFSYITGRLGVSNALFRMAEIDGKEHWKQSGLEIAKKANSFLDTSVPANDLINGFCGIIYSLVQLYQLSKAPFLLDSIQLFLDKFIANAFLTETGIYWDRSSRISKGLCGFSHGNASYTWLFSYLSKLQNNSIFKKIAEASLAYENNFFNAEMSNWPDFRHGIYTDNDLEKHLKNFKENNLDFFDSPNYMNAWCHGAMGIGLSRLDCLKYLDNQEIKRDIDSAIKTVQKNNVENEHYLNSYTLCHGLGGNADLLIEASLEFKDDTYLNQAKIIGEKYYKAYEELQYNSPGLSFAKAGEEDDSLFMGNAGISYFFLRLHAPDKVPSVLRPSLVSNFKLDIKSNHLNLIIVKKYFPKTINLLEFHKIDLTNIIGFTSNELINSLSNLIAKLNPELKLRATDIFDLEAACFKKDLKQISFSLSFIKFKSILGFHQKNPDFYLNGTLFINSDYTIHKHQWSWNDLPIQEALTTEADEYESLILPDHKQSYSLSLSDFSKAVIIAFKNGNTLPVVQEEITELFEVNTEEEKQQVCNAVQQQVQQAYLSGILIDVSLNIGTLKS